MTDRPIFDALNKPLKIPEEQPDSLAIQGEHSKAGTDVSIKGTTDFAGPGGWAAGGQGGWSSTLGGYVKGWVSFLSKKK